MNDLLLLPIGVVVGIINAVAGGGSLLSFPAFLALGYPPLIANVTNAVGVFASNLGAVFGYRSELWKLRKEVLLLCLAAIAGSTVGALLLLRAGEDTFEAIVPWLIVAGSMLMLFQPMIVKRVAAYVGPQHFVLGVIGCGVVAVYGGYFGAAMGIMFMAVFGVLVHQPLQQLNALKNAVGTCVNGTCVVIFGLFSDVVWSAAALLSVGTLIGGVIGSRIAKRLPDRVFRLVVVAVGLVAAVLVSV